MNGGDDAAGVDDAVELKVGDARLISLLQLGDLFRRTKQYSKARAAFIECTNSYPSDFRAYYNLGALCLFSQNIESYQQAKSFFIAAFEKLAVVIAATDAVPQQSDVLSEIAGSVAGVALKLQQGADAVRWCELGLNLRSGYAVSDEVTSLEELHHLNSTCLYNYNTAMRQEGRILEALHFSWRVIESKLRKCSEQQSVSALVDMSPPLLRSSRGENAGKAITLHFVCVKWGSKYGADYVNNLCRAINRRMQCLMDAMTSRRVQYQCYCLTESSCGVDEDITCLPLLRSDMASVAWQGWWFKAALFQPQLLGENIADAFVCYFDLDTIFCGSKIFEKIVDYVYLASSSDDGAKMVTLTPAGMFNEGEDIRNTFV
jgi:hypothetical protein